MRIQGHAEEGEKILKQYAEQNSASCEAWTQWLILSGLRGRSQAAGGLFGIHARPFLVLDDVPALRGLIEVQTRLGNWYGAGPVSLLPGRRA